MTLEDALVAIVVIAALAFLVRRFVGPTSKPKPSQKPDVPLSRLTRRRKKDP